MTTLRRLTLMIILAAAIVPPNARAVDIPASGSAPTPAAPLRSRHVYLIGSLLISQVWLQRDGGDKASGFLSIENRSAAPDRLTGVTFAEGVSAAVALSGTEEPSPGDGVAIPPNAILTLKPGAVHLALSGLPGQMPDDKRLEGTLHFERSGSLRVSFSTDPGDAEDDAPAAPPAQEKTTSVNGG